MPSLKQIKSRTKSVNQISKITKAMQMVSASRMKKAQNEAIKSYPYSIKLYEIMQNLQTAVAETQSDLAKVYPRATNNLIIYFSSDKGLVGGLNSAVRKTAVLNFPKESKFVVVGKKGARQLAGVKKEVLSKYNFPKNTDLENFLAIISQEITNLYKTGEYKEVNCIYPKFITTATQKPEVVKLLPVGNLENTTKIGANYLFEPNKTEILKQLLKDYLEVQILNAVYSTNASEHSARMVAMKNATDNAQALANRLTHVYNVKRQQRITTEILELNN